MTRPLADKVIVITGASSGLGRATAIAFAQRRARVVLAARDLAALEEVGAACRRAGGQALAVETDVIDEAAVRRLAGRALELTGRVDVWINNAGVTAFGLLDEIPFEHHRRVFEVNVYGAIYGARAVMPVFRRQRAGVLINVSSVLGKVAQPYVPSYVISKFALQGLSETLRTTFADEPDVHICTLLPYSIETPHFEHGANYVGHPAHPIPPVQPPEKVARALVDLAERPRRERHVPRLAKAGLALHAVLPGIGDRLLLHLTRGWHFDRPPEPSSAGNLYAPHAASVRGHRRARTTLPRLLLWGAASLLRRRRDPHPDPQ